MILYIYIYLYHFRVVGPPDELCQLDSVDVSNNIENLESQFTDLHKCILDELIANKDMNIQKLLQRLTLLPIKLRSEYQKIISEKLPTLPREGSISELFLHLNPLFTFIDYHLLEYIIKVFGSNSLKIKMQSYSHEISSFLKQTTIQQLIDYWPCQEEEDPKVYEIIAKIDKDAKSCTLHELNTLRRKICVSVRLSDIISAAVSIRNSTSFIISWSLPSVLASHVITSLNEIEEDFFESEKIESLFVGDVKVYPRVTLAETLLAVAMHSEDSVVSEMEEYDLASFASELKKQYQLTEVTIFPHEWMALQIKKIFKLAVIHKMQLSWQPVDDFVRKTITGKVDDILNDKTPIELENIFKANKGKRQQFVLLEGAPSSGKSSLAIYICQKWGKGELFEEFTLVILVQLGDPAVQRAQSISDLLPCQDVAVARKLAAELEATKGRGVLWILDGWDELPPQLRQDSIFCQLMPPKPSNKHQTLVPQTKESQSPIIQTEHYSLGMLCESSFIITSRPISSGDLHPVVSSRIELVGLSSEDQRQYFTECLEGDTEALEDLLVKIQDNPIVQSSCYIPLNAALTLHYFKLKGHSLPNTEYEMFSTVIFSCIKHHLEQEGKGDDLPLELKSLGDVLSSRAVGEHFKRLCELAYNGVMQHKVTFSPNDFPQGSSTLGLLHKMDSFLEGGKSAFYRFFHHSLLEVLAAMHMATCLSDVEQASQFQQLFDQPHFFGIFRFYSAITKLKTPGIDEVMKIIYDYPKPKLVQLLKCIYEAQNSSLHLVLPKRVGFLNLYRVFLSPLECLSIGYFISMSSSDVSGCFNLGRCQIGDKGVKYLTKFMCESSSPILHTKKTSSTRTSSSGWKFFLLRNDIHEDGAASIAKVLQSDFCVITSLTLSDNPIGGQGLQLISEGLITNTSLVELNLSDCSLVISEENGPVVTEMLIKNKTLRTLNMSYNKGIMLSQTSLSYIADGLIMNTSLVELNMSYCSLVISEENGPVVTEMLIKNKTLRTLNLSNNKGIMISQTSLSYIADGLIMNTSLVELNMSYCSLVISEENGPVVTEMLIKNKTLKTLSLSDYKGEGMILDSGLSYIAEGLKRNSALEELTLINVTAQGGKSLATAIATNNSIALIRLNINCLEITKESGPTFVNMLQQNGSLDFISFNFSRRLSDVGVSFIAEGLQKNTTVRSMHLHGCNITSSGAKCLAEMLKVNSYLKNLFIGNNPIRDEGVAHLAEALKMNKTLRYLSMNSCEITDAGVASLTDSLRMNRSLNNLDLYDNRGLTKEGVKPLLDVASIVSVEVSVDCNLSQYSLSIQKSTDPGLDIEETSK